MQPEDSKKSEQEDKSTGSEDKQKTAFFITPLGSDNSDIRRSTDGLINAVIRPVLQQHNIHLIPPHEITEPGTITRQIVRHILKADLVIANLTGLNANVMYELAVRHARRKPTIIIAQQDTVLPFDLAAERTIFYQNDMAGAVQLTKRLHDTIPGALADVDPENPIYNGLDSLLIREKVKGEHDQNSINKYLIDQLDKLNESLSFLRNSVTHQQPSISQITPSTSTLHLYNFHIRFDEPIHQMRTAELKEIIAAIYPMAKDLVYTDINNEAFSSITFNDFSYTVPRAANQNLKTLLDAAGMEVSSLSAIRIH